MLIFLGVVTVIALAAFGLQLLCYASYKNTAEKYPLDNFNHKQKLQNA